MRWLGTLWLGGFIFTSLWFWYLHSKGEFMGEYTYEDEM